MEDSSWIKLYRKLDNNEIIRDTHALQLFIFLLINVPRETGEYSTGRKLLAAQLGVKEATVYAALMRLQRKYHMVQVSSNNKYTTIRLLNWAKYQEKSLPSQPNNNDITTTSQRDNTITRIENKEERRESGGIVLTKNQLTSLEEEFPKVDVPRSYERFKLWQQANGKTFTNTLARFKMWLQDEKRNVKIISKKTPEFRPNLPSPEEMISDEKVAELMRKKRELLHT